MGAGYGGKGGILTVELRDQASLFKAYMPFVKGGGIFVPTARAHKMGEEVFVLLQLLEQREPIPVAAKVIWVSPAGSSTCLLYTSPSPRDQRGSRMPSSA